MDPMIIGRSITKKASTVSTYYTRWQPRQGNSGTFTCEVISNLVGSNLTLTVQTKSLEQPDSGASDLGNVTLTTVINSVNVSGCKDVVRCKITTPNTAATGAYFIRPLQPQWEYN
jgi:hypothetical protein